MTSSLEATLDDRFLAAYAARRLGDKAYDNDSLDRPLMETWANRVDRTTPLESRDRTQDRAPLAT